MTVSDMGGVKLVKDSITYMDSYRILISVCVQKNYPRPNLNIVVYLVLNTD